MRTHIFESLNREAEREDRLPKSRVELFFWFIMNPSIGAFLWPYAINHWLTMAGKQPQIEWYHGVLISFTPHLGRYHLLAAIITWIVVKFL